MIIVLETGGKRDCVYYVRVKLFENRNEAQEYCNKTTDNPMNEKYWRYAEIIEEGHEYEMGKYKNYY